jgi:hypothetical protein
MENIPDDYACELLRPPGPHTAWVEEASVPSSESVHVARAKSVALIRHILNYPPFSKIPGIAGFVAFWNLADDPAFPDEAFTPLLTAYIWCATRVCAVAAYARRRALTLCTGGPVSSPLPT